MKVVPLYHYCYLKHEPTRNHFGERLYEDKSRYWDYVPLLSSWNPQTQGVFRQQVQQAIADGRTTASAMDEMTAHVLPAEAKTFIHDSKSESAGHKHSFGFKPTQQTPSTSS